MKFIILNICALMVVLYPNHHLLAQKLTVGYTAELQTNKHATSKWVNLLRCDFSKELTTNLEMQIATISVVRTKDEPLAYNLQTFSNIEEENTALALAICGISWKNKQSSGFIGIRNLNEDFFTSPCTSLFTNSSCGIFPTISLNFPIANYPVASVGAGYKLSLRKCNIETYLYNGIGYKRFTGKKNVFRFCPQSDGFIHVTSINYQHYASNYFLGTALYYGTNMDDEKSSEEIPTIKTKKELNYVVWGYGEQKLTKHLYTLMQYSVCFPKQNFCHYYTGTGLIYRCRQSEGGIFTNYVSCEGKHEWATELTCKLFYSEHVFIQPALHFIINNYERACIGLFRLGVNV